MLPGRCLEREDLLREYFRMVISVRTRGGNLSASARCISKANGHFSACCSTQNEELWREYLDGAWAHISPIEVGGLACRQPLQAQLVSLMRSESGACGGWGERLRARLQSELPADASTDALESWRSNTNYMYKLAEGMITETLQGVAGRATNGRIDARSLSAEERQLLQMYSETQEEWQQVPSRDPRHVLRGVPFGSGWSSYNEAITALSHSPCTQVVLLLDSAAGSASGVAINRPLAKMIDRPLAELLLKGVRLVASIADKEKPILLLYDAGPLLVS